MPLAERAILVLRSRTDVHWNLHTKIGLPWAAAISEGENNFMRTTRALRAGAAIASLLIVVAACGSDDSSSSDATTAAPASESTAAPAETTAPATEATTAPASGATTTPGSGSAAVLDTDCTNPGEAVTPPPPPTTGPKAETLPPEAAGAAGALEGFKGTTPLVKLSDDFKQQLLGIDSSLSDFNYAAESYDAVTLIALAAEYAKCDGSVLGDHIVEVSGGGDNPGEKCTTYADCKAIIDAGKLPDYDGQSGPITMNGNGEPLVASYGVLSFGADNRIDDSKTTFISANAPEAAKVDLTPVDVTRAGDGVLKIGSLLPQTGSLAFLGPPEFAGVQLAIDQINAAGGVLGNPVEYSAGDSGDTSTDTASQTSDRLLNEGVDAIIGAASSSVSLTVVDKITAAGVVQFSPANTSDKFTTYADHGLYFRTAPPDVLQGSVLGQVIIDDGISSAYILALDDAYGTGLADRVEEVLTGGGVEVLGKTIYDPKATSFSSEIQAVKDAQPDAIVLISFDEGSRVLRGLVEAGIGPNVIRTYGVDGNTGNALGENFDAGK